MIIFHSDRSGTFDMYIATRLSETSFGAPTPLTNINTNTTGEIDGTFTSASTFYFVRTNLVPSIIGVFEADLTGAPSAITSLSGLYFGGPSLTADGLEMFLTKHDDTLDTDSLYRATRDSPTGPWNVVGAVDELNALGAGYATLTGDGLTIYYEQQEARIATATRSARDQPFGPSTIVLDEPGTTDSDPGISRDGNTMVFARAIGTDSTDIYIMTRSCP